MGSDSRGKPTTFFHSTSTCYKQIQSVNPLGQMRTKEKLTISSISIYIHSDPPTWRCSSRHPPYVMSPSLGPSPVQMQKPIKCETRTSNYTWQWGSFARCWPSRAHYITSRECPSPYRTTTAAHELPMSLNCWWSHVMYACLPSMLVTGVWGTTQFFFYVGTWMC